MLRPDGSIRRFRLAALLLLAPCTGCATWTPVAPAELADAVAARSPSRLRVHLEGGSEIDVRDPIVVDSMLQGVVPVRRGGVRTRDPVQVPLREIVASEVREFQKGRTLVLVGGVVVVLAVFPYHVICRLDSVDCG